MPETLLGKEPIVFVAPNQTIISAVEPELNKLLKSESQSFTKC